MSQHDTAESHSQLKATANVPLSEWPLMAEDERTVISGQESARSDIRIERSAEAEVICRRLFASNGARNGDEAGVRIAHFEITERLGAGGMGAVFKASDLELARHVALKIMHPNSVDASLVARFRNEARSCAQLNHDNIARVYYAGSHEGLFFIAYEFASGRTIRDLIIERGQIGIDETVNYAIQVTLALNHIASAGIVHRDIKPANIMLTTSGRVKVVDLGLARRDVTDSIGEITVAGTTLGTFDYISPEQARDPREADVRSDIYSLGCTMYHMLTGRPPYPEGTALQKLLDHQGKSPPDPRAVNRAIPEELTAIMRKMMANNPNHRYQAPGLLLNDLIQLAAMLGLHSIPAEGIVWRRLNASERRVPVGAVWVFASVLVICFSALLMQWMSNSRQPADNVAGRGDSLGTLVDPGMYASVTLPVTDTLQSAAGVSDNPGTSSTSTNGESTVSAKQPASSVVGGSNALASDLRIPLPVFPNEGLLNSSLVQMILSQSGSSEPQVAVAGQTGPFILQTSDGRSQSFRTLNAAVADAKTGDVVLLRYNGYPDDLPAQPPLRIVGMNLIIRAADGFRPTLEFDGLSDGAFSSGKIFSLRSGGSLSMKNIDLRLIVGEDTSAERGCLFQSVGPNRITLENVSIDCRNSRGQPVVLFDLVDDPGAASDSSGLSESEVTLSHVNCRADADAFRVACQPRGRIALDDCGFVLNGTFLQVPGDNSMAAARGSLELFLNHVTCIHAAPLIHVFDNDEQTGDGVQRTVPRISVRSEASVLAGTGSEPRLLYSSGNAFVEDTESLVTWNGFTNLYGGYTVFWQIETSALDDSIRRMDFSQWKQFWHNRIDGEETNAEQIPAFAWQNPDWRDGLEAVSLSEVRPSVFELDAAVFLPGSQSLPRARDGRVPGVNPQQLPPFPVGISGLQSESVSPPGLESARSLAEPPSASDATLPSATVVPVPVNP